MKKTNLILSIVFSIIGAVLSIMYYVFVGASIIESNNISYLFIIAYFATCWLPAILDWLFKIRLSLLANIIYQVFLVFSILIGSLWEVYNHLAFYDIILHSLCGVVIAVIAYSLYMQSKTNKLGSVWLFILMFSISLACGGLWEIWEFLTDIIMNGNSQRTMGFVGQDAILDTMLDIVCDCCGAIIGAVLVVVFERRRKKRKALSDQNTNDKVIDKNSIE